MLAIDADINLIKSISSDIIFPLSTYIAYRHIANLSCSDVLKTDKDCYSPVFPVLDFYSDS